MNNNKKNEIMKLLNNGKTSSEIINLGYKPGTVYSTQREWRSGKPKIPSTTRNKVTTNNLSSSSTPQFNITSPDIESDPDIVKLKKQIRAAELEKQLGILKVPFEAEILIAATLENGERKREMCPFLEDDLCMFFDWQSDDERPQNIGEWVFKGKDSWRIRPSPFYCATCDMELHMGLVEVENNIKSTPLLNIRNRHTCECGSNGMVAVMIKCTKCGKEKWWGWWPEKRQRHSID